MNALRIKTRIMAAALAAALLAGALSGCVKQASDDSDIFNDAGTSSGSAIVVDPDEASSSAG